MVSPHDQVGREAVDMLVRKIDQPAVPLEPVALKHTFVEGLSLWAPPELGAGSVHVQESVCVCLRNENMACLCVFHEPNAAASPWSSFWWPSASLCC
jgi:hypothetical protein